MVISSWLASEQLSQEVIEDLWSFSASMASVAVMEAGFGDVRGFILKNRGI